MKAVLLKGNGGFEQLEYREDVPAPAPGAGEVLIRVAAAGVNNTDINTRTAWYAKTPGGAGAGGAAAAGWTGAPPVFPRIQGADACGRIVAVGAGVASTRIGERVLVEPVFRRPGSADPFDVIYFGSECDGAFAEFAAVPAVHAHKISSPLTDAELASFPCSYSAAENMLARTGLRAGETVLITGASGGVGSAAVQLARRRGAQIIALASPSKAASVEALGARRVAGRGADIVSDLAGEKIDVVIDVAGGPQFPSLLDVLRRGGRYAVAGAIAGTDVALDLRTLYLKDLRFFGCTVLEPQVFSSLMGYIERGEIRPLVARAYPLSAIVDAQRDFLNKTHIGKIVLTPPLRE